MPTLRCFGSPRSMATSVSICTRARSASCCWVMNGFCLARNQRMRSPRVWRSLLLIGAVSLETRCLVATLAIHFCDDLFGFSHLVFGEVPIQHDRARLHGGW